MVHDVDLLVWKSTVVLFMQNEKSRSHGFPRARKVAKFDLRDFREAFVFYNFTR